MPFTTRIAPRASRQINSWGLEEPVWLEVLFHLYQTLPANSQAVLQSLPELPRGMLYYFTVQAPERADQIHEFVFQIIYDADEQHLDVLRGSYWRHVGGLPDS